MRTRSLFFILSVLSSNILLAQHATITEEKRELLTYPFGNPDPMPILAEKGRKVYPNHSFDGYSVTGKKQQWKVVKLENEYIQVFVLPEAGGKIWGAIEKSTGKEFIYRNEVMKFRNISLRGPWTSGGIEFNFGTIGHSPSTATPVDYTTRVNADGSVSCIVGNMDLPSRTQWRVEIRLPKDKAYFETRALWNNPTPLSQSYYNWMTASAAVTNDLEFFYPGNQELGHNGEDYPWPIDSAGRDLSKYRNNAFGSDKSMHTVGEYNDFMGGYYHSSAFGFGHWSLYDDMPGHKLWLWGQARSGAIWKDLLTDTDGQYMEFQAGRGFNQYSATSFRSPITEMSFSPGLTDSWNEIWFPVKGIGGLQEVSPMGILSVARAHDSLMIGINALAFASAKVIVKSNERILFTKAIQLTPMQVFKTAVPLSSDSAYEVVAEGMDLRHSSTGGDLIKRPFVTTIPADSSSGAYLYQQAMDQKKNRNYTPAKQLFNRCLQKDPLYIDAFAGLAELYYRSGQYDSALYFANRALQLNTYHAAANYYAGITYRAQKDFINALETFGWAARSTEFRSAAYTQMAAVELAMKNLPLAEHYALLALDFDRKNLSALKILAVQYRKANDPTRADQVIEEIDTLDPLNHFAHFERFLLHPSDENYSRFSNAIKNEFPYQTYLEILLNYYGLGMNEDALRLLDKAPAHPLLSIWKAYLLKDEKELAAALLLSPAFVFPYRTETAAALEWASSKNAHWKLKYYLGLNYWAMDRPGDALTLFEACGKEPDFAPFYLTRAYLLKTKDARQELADLQTARQLDAADWRNWNKLIDYYESSGDNQTALSLSMQAAQRFKGNSNLALQRARVLLANGQYAASVKILENTHILPFEGSTQGKNVYEQACMLDAIVLMNKKRYNEALTELRKSATWPENLGVGSPYDPDNRMQQYLEAICLDKSGRTKEAGMLRDSIVQFTNAGRSRSPFNDLLAIKILQKAGKTEQSNRLLERMAAEAQSGDLPQRWVLAVATNDTVAAGSLEKDMKFNGYLKIIKEIQAFEK